MSAPPPENRGLFVVAAEAAYATLRPHERERFDLVLGPGACASAASVFLASGVENDRWADRVQPWWNAHADDVTEALTFLTGVTQDEARALLTAVLYMTAGRDEDLATHAILRHAERAAAFMFGARQ